MSSKEVLLAKSFADSGIDPTGWWMSEKLDGLRATWDGKTFRSRTGKVFNAPDWFRAKMPALPLDGELWMGRGQFQRATSVVRSSADKGWKDVVYMVFDIPDASAGPFEQRLSMLETLVRAAPQGYTPPAWLRIVEHVRCTSREHLERATDELIALGAEGVMLRRPGSDYEFRRSSTLLKVKRFHDAEAVVTGYQAGKGRHVGALGALDCVTEAGVQFQIGTGFSDAERASPPPIGSRVTYRYQELTKDGVPRFPSFVCVRDYE